MRLLVLLADALPRSRNTSRLHSNAASKRWRFLSAVVRAAQFRFWGVRRTSEDMPLYPLMTQSRHSSHPMSVDRLNRWLIGSSPWPASVILRQPARLLIQPSLAEARSEGWPVLAKKTGTSRPRGHQGKGSATISKIRDGERLHQSAGGFLSAANEGQDFHLG